MQDKNIKDLIIIKRNLEKSLLVKQARKSFKTFCEYVFGLKPGKIHLEWHNLATKAMMEGEPCIIFAPRSHAKCHTLNTIITLADGSLKEAKDCKVGDEVISYDVENFRFVPAKIVNIIDNGIKDIYEVKLASGKSIEVTSNHPFLTADGWKSIEEGLREKEKIAVPIYISRVNVKKHFTDNQLKILAYLIAEGSVANHKKKIVFTNANREIVEDLNRALEEEFGLKLKKANMDNYDYYIAGNGKKFCKKEFLDFLEKYGLAGKYSYNKEIPKELFTSPEADIKLFLKCLWLCDGSIYKVKRKTQSWKNDTCIEYSTSSEKLAYQIQTLLEYIGIPSNIYRRKTPKKDNFMVSIFGGKEFKLKFLKEVLNRKTEDILDYVKKAHPSTYATIPRKLVLKFLPLTPHFIRKYYGLRIDNNYDITYEKLRKLIKIFPNIPQLQLLLKAPIRWDRIIKIEYKGKKPTIGLEIEKYHNHITNGIITHNTSYMAVMRPIFLLGHNPNLRIKIVSHSDKKAADILRQIKEAIESNERLKEVFPHLEAGDVWASNKILVKRSLWSKDVTIEALGVLSGATGGRCIGKGTLIITSSGVKPIEEITEKDKVLTREGKFRRVVKTWKRPYKGKVIVVKSKYQNFNKIVLTPEHKVFIKEINKKGEVKIGWIPIKEVLEKKKENKYYLVFPRFKFIGTHKVSSNKDFQKEVERYFKDKDFWRLAGYYLAEGCLSDYDENALEKENFGKGKHCRINIHFGSHELNYIEDVCSILNKWNNHYWIYTSKKGSTSIHFHNKILWKLFTTFGHKAPNKRIPYWVWETSTENQLEFIKSYLKGDGCIDKKGNLHFTTTSLNIAVFLSILLTRFGCFARIHKNTSRKSDFSKTSLPLYQIILDYSSALRVIEFLQGKKEKVHFSDTFWYYDNNYIYIPISEIYEEDYDDYVYDLSVDVENSFCSIWAILHNSDYLIFDDVVEFNNTIKHPALIKMVKEAFYNNWLNLLEPDGYGWCLIGTIWTQMDLHWEFHQKPLKYKKIYRINLETLEPIWEEHWSKEKLIERYNSMPLRAFARAFALLPISREDAVFNRENIETCIVYNDPKYYREKCDYVIIGVDLAISQKKTAANTAIFVMGVIKEKNKLVALHAEYGKWTSPETVNAITKNFEDWKADIIIVENNQYQEALIQWLNEFNRELPVQAHFTTSAKHDPEIGLPSMALEFERKKWIIPMGKLPHDVDCKCGKCKWIEELTMYPFGETSDIVMASYFAREYWRKHIVSKEDVKIDTL